MRLQTSAEVDSATPCAVLLVGQQTLARQLRMGIVAAADRRITVRYHLPPMDLGESVAYLRHHLALAGRTHPVIADHACTGLHKRAAACRALSTTGIAALINAAAAAKRLGRVAVPDDIGRVAVFLATDAAPYMTGSLVFVDGGFLLRCNSYQVTMLKPIGPPPIGRFVTRGL